MAPLRYISNATAKKLLDNFLFEHGPNRVDIIPKRVDPAYADRYLRETVKPDMDAVVFRQARRVVDFYTLRQTLPHFAEMLDRSEGDAAALNRSAEIVQMLGEVGMEADWKLADDYFQNHLLRLRMARDFMPTMMRIWADLGPQSSVDALEKQFGEEVAFREKMQNTSDDAEISYQRLRAVYENDFPRAKRAVAYRAEVERMKDPTRLKALVDNYARLDDYPPEYLNEWSARMLRWAGADAEPRAKLLTMMRERINQLPGSREFDKEMKLFAKRRLLRAIDYFDPSVLSPDDVQFLNHQLSVALEGDQLSTIQPEPVHE